MPDPSSLSPSGTPLFEMADLSCRMGERTLLDSLTLQLPAQRLIGLVGHNGSGKSTLLKILARLQAASTGEVHFAGTPLARWRDRPFARKVAYLPQQPPPAPGLLVKELVGLGRYPWHGPLGRFREADRALVDEALALADVAQLADRLVDTLSGGERQRAWLAMMVAQDTECLLLDEPIAALDLAHQIDVLALVQNLCRSRGIGALVVLHDINLAARFCEEILALRAGRLIARGTPEEILTPERLLTIFGLQMDVLVNPANGQRIATAR
ncbi:ATP-binding cassette domain-containing protein [Ancylobacter sp. MQZ15Z-1]|uniref:ATP-binding cassette domain-containing protein n=1 Tax=Ancylobacter mangrovi TaxID=2972472 RepID=A0A9X2PDV4_9HYPH|nr:ATP-binding cassette domain-containing protein [Ancylobacter mangrovi]MCS0496904.1 ATP-binding cassette domain-containing protein [Ancylobacter mangrovi]